MIMRTDWESRLERWETAGLIDAAAAAGIRAWESSQSRSRGLHWPVLLALAFGALMLAAGVILFVSAHWDELDSAGRLTLVVAMVAALYAGGAAVAGRFASLSIALHTVGTVALGAGIALLAQTFQLAGHWPAEVLLWAFGAAIAWLLLGHWTQAALVAILVPYWLAGEWWILMKDTRVGYFAPVSAGICALSLTYLSARRDPDDDPLRKALAWLGGLALLPSAAITAFDWHATPPGSGRLILGWSVAILTPFAVALTIRGRGAVWNAVAIFWSMILSALSYGRGDRILVYIWCAIGSAALAYWGVSEARAERINLGITGFALTLLAFYFSSVMDKIGRSESLIALGLLFLGGGWVLERARRRLLSQIRPEVL